MMDEGMAEATLVQANGLFAAPGSGATIENADAQRVIEQLYRCVSDRKFWPDALRSIADFLEVKHCAIAHYGALRQCPVILAAHNIDAAFESDLVSDIPLNPLFYLPITALSGATYALASYFGSAAFASSAWHRRALQPRSIDNCLTQVLMRSGSGTSLLLAFTRDDERQGDAKRLARLHGLAPHLSQAFRLADILNDLTEQHSLLSGAFDLLSIGLVLVDRKSHILHANRVASQALSDGAAIGRSGNAIFARDPRAAKELREAIKSLGSRSLAPEIGLGASVFLPGEGKGDLTAWIHPLKAVPGIGAETTIAVFLKRTESVSPAPEQIIAQRYNLTHCEIRVLGLLMQGLTLTETAEACAVSYNTMKTHLGNLFRKTGARRQAELVRLASALAPPIH